MEITVKKYDNSLADEWDQLIAESRNGTFLQSRKFMNYHPEGRFEDYSLLFYEGNELIAVILANVIREGERKIFFSHKGTSYGGIVLAQSFYSVEKIACLMEVFIDYCRENGFDEVFMRMTPDLYARQDMQLVHYYLVKMGCRCYNELNFYMDLQPYKEDILSCFSSGKRRDYRYSLKNELTFQELREEEILKFYQVLQKNQKKLGIGSVHSIEELTDLKKNRFPDKISFYEVEKDGKCIAGSMIFRFDNGVFHTQYLASDEEYLSCYPMEFLIYHLINTAVREEQKFFSFGICTEDLGRYLNIGLARFKEGFGADYGINYSYRIKLDEGIVE